MLVRITHVMLFMFRVNFGANRLQPRNSVSDTLLLILSPPPPPPHDKFCSLRRIRFIM